ncbi:MAG: histidinol phosphate phosphatase, partial [Rhodospirillaceae bacterium]
MDHGGALLHLLHDLADLSGERALRYFRANVAVDTKADASP